MPIDSTAELLFKIGANSDDAESNIKRFRTVLGKDLGDMRAEFSDWSTKVFGNLATVQGGLVAVTSALGAALVGAVAYANKATTAYAEYAEQLDSASDVTGIQIEKLSGIKYAADNAGTSWTAMVKGLGFFSDAVVKANTGGEEQIRMFKRMGISQHDVAQGEKDLMPLLEKTMDWFKQSASAVDRTSVARAAFSRGGTEMLDFLQLGSDGLKKMADEAHRLGLEMSSEDVLKAKELLVSMKQLENQSKSLEIITAAAGVSSGGGSMDSGASSGQSKQNIQIFLEGGEFYSQKQVERLVGVINDAVGRDVTLTATNTITGRRLQQ